MVSRVRTSFEHGRQTVRLSLTMTQEIMKGIEEQNIGGEDTPQGEVQ